MALTTKQIPALPPGVHLDGEGLYLYVGKSGSRSWVFRYQIDRKRREMGIGPAADVSGPEAREKAAQARALIRQGIDPLDARQQASEGDKAKAAKVKTFADVARDYIAAHRAGWRNVKHAAQWEATLAAYASPVFGRTPVTDINTELVLRALQRDKLWTTKPETASRVRSRIELVLSFAKAKGLRDGENPALWRGHLDALLPKPGKVKRVVHHPALPYPQMADFMSELRNAPGTAARALEFAILTAARSGEVRFSQWGEIDRDGEVWNVPAGRMKAERAHRVPLSRQALALLDALPRVAGETIIFPGERTREAMSDMALTAVLRRMNKPEETWIDPTCGRQVVPHGFRSVFRDWASEATHYPHEMAEMALAHTVGNRVEAAYRRGDQFEKRREMMQTWANFCESVPEPVAKPRNKL